MSERPLYVVLVIETEASQEQGPDIPLVLLQDSAGRPGTVDIPGHTDLEQVLSDFSVFKR